MPIFEYRCAECGNSFEKIRRTPTEQETCPLCGGRADRAVSAPVAGASSAGIPAAGPSCGGSGFT